MAEGEAQGERCHASQSQSSKSPEYSLLLPSRPRALEPFFAEPFLPLTGAAAPVLVSPDAGM